MRRLHSLVPMLTLFALSISTEVFSQTSEPSFNCSNKLTQIEQTICTNNRLAKLDVKLATLYKTVRKTGDNDFQTDVKASQLEWLKQRNTSCGSDLKNGQAREDCIELHYLRRIFELYHY